MLTRFIPIRVTVHARVRSISLCPPTLIMSVHLSSGKTGEANKQVEQFSPYFISEGGGRGRGGGERGGGLDTSDSPSKQLVTRRDFSSHP